MSLSIKNLQDMMVGRTGASIDSRLEYKVGEALLYLVPIMIKGQRGYEPRPGRFLMSGYEFMPWKRLPGYPDDSFHSEIEDYHTWFTVFSDSIGVWFNFYYPNSPAIGDPIEVLTPYGVIHWVHGVRGLAKFAQVHYVKWLFESHEA